MKIKITIKETNNVNFDELIPKLQHNIIKIGANELNGIIRKNTPKNEGHLHSTWRHSIHENEVIFTNSAKYAVWVNEGTGIYGPRKTRIFPHKGKGLLFKPDKKYDGKYGPTLSGGKFKGYYFFRSIRGQKGQHYVEKSAKKLKSRLPAIIHNALNSVSNGG